MPSDTYLLTHSLRAVSQLPIKPNDRAVLLGLIAQSKRGVVRDIDLDTLCRENKIPMRSVTASLRRLREAKYIDDWGWQYPTTICTDRVFAGFEA